MKGGKPKPTRGANNCSVEESDKVVAGAKRISSSFSGGGGGEGEMAVKNERLEEARCGRQRRDLAERRKALH